MMRKLIVSFLLFTFALGCVAQNQRGLSINNTGLASVNISGIKNVALVIGTDEYEDNTEWPKLANPVFDAQTLAQVLKDDYHYQVVLLVNPKRHDILDSFAKLQRMFAGNKLGTDANLLVFIAGHGGYDDFNPGYIVPGDAKKTTDDPDRGSYISQSILREKIQTINARHKLVLMDACFGGTFDEELTYRAGNAMGSQYSDIDYRKLLMDNDTLHTAKLIASGGRKYVSDGAPGHHSPFASRIINELMESYKRSLPVTYFDLYAAVGHLDPKPHASNFSYNDPGSDFVLIPNSLFAAGQGTANATAVKQMEVERGKKEGVQKHYIGELFGGGTIFFLDESASHGLIAAPFDQSKSVKWSNGVNFITGAAETKVGSGSANTIAIIQALGQGEYAASICHNYGGGGFNDWFLPSKDELYLMYSKRLVIGNFSIGCDQDFGACSYWSSSENTIDFGWNLYFNSGVFWSNYGKNGLCPVRAIRKF